MEFGSNSMSSSSPSSSSSSPQYKTSLAPSLSSSVFDGPDTKLELMNSNDAAAADEPSEKEHMFDKVVTPSDVGKLNRLVIPKQHAEKYFPLDSSSNEKGLLLSFEDRTGKQWRFRYSYWNSSQSYVMTKGWSRFVKEKKLVAGDVVSFHRTAANKDRLFIDWRHRSDAPDQFHYRHVPAAALYPPGISFGGVGGRPAPWFMTRLPSPGAHYTSPSGNYNYNYAGIGVPHYHQNPYRNSYIVGGGGGGGGSYAAYGGNVPPPGAVFYVRPQAEQSQLAVQRGGRVVGGEASVVFDSVPVVHGNKAAVSGKRLRLFGVNMECPTSESSASEECEILTSSASGRGIDSSSQVRPLQLRLFNGTPIPGISSSVEYLNKGKASMTAFNLDI